MKWKAISNNLFDLNKQIDDYSNRYNEDVRDSFQLFRDVYTTLIRKRIKLNLKYWYISEGEQIHPTVDDEARKEVVETIQLKLQYHKDKERAEQANKRLVKIQPPMKLGTIFIGVLFHGAVLTPLFTFSF